MMPSDKFVRLTRNPDLPSPQRFEPTVKHPDDVIIGKGGGRVSRMAAAA
jgi:hypothetical protein